MCDTEKLFIFNQCKTVPDEAKKPIKGGRLNNMTDINPMWRIKKLTEMFGPCGIGWNTKNETYQYKKGDNTDEIVVFYELDLVFKYEGAWSEPVHGVGGAKFTAVEKGALFVNDEAIKMARTDAISVACKSLGMGASVYWDRDPESKYGANLAPDPPAKTAAPKQQAQAKAPAQQATKAAPKATPAKEQAPAKTPSKYQQVAALIKEDTTEYWNMETVNEWISKTLGKDCRVNDLPDDVFAQLLERMRGQQ